MEDQSKAYIFDKYDFMNRDQLKAACRALEAKEDTMSLYQVANGVRGENAYVRVYVWDTDFTSALNRSLESFHNNGYSRTVVDDLKARLVLRRWYDPFVTVPTDHGFPTIREQERGV